MAFWKAPKPLARLLRDGEISRTEYVVLHYAAESGADLPQGLTTSNGELADELGYNRKTVGIALRRLRALRLLAYDDHERIARFTLKTTEALAALESLAIPAKRSRGAASSASGSPAPPHLGN